MTAARVVWTLDSGRTVEVSANLTIGIVPDSPAPPDPRPVAETASRGELTFVRDESVSCELPPQTRRFLVARWPDGLTKVREVRVGEAGDRTAADALIEALTHPSLYLAGDGRGGVGLHCGDHFNDGKPIAYYGEPWEHPGTPTVSTVPSLWAEAVKHLESAHRIGDTA
jgi:hypothetical protein